MLYKSSLLRVIAFGCADQDRELKSTTPKIRTVQDLFFSHRGLRRRHVAKYTEPWAPMIIKLTNDILLADDAEPTTHISIQTNNVLVSTCHSQKSETATYQKKAARLLTDCSFCPDRMHASRRLEAVSVAHSIHFDYRMDICEMF